MSYYQILWSLKAWWHHQMETFSALLAICAGNSPVPGEFPAQRPVTRSFDVFFDLHLNTRLSKQSWGWWFETLSRPLWRHHIAMGMCAKHITSFWNLANILTTVLPRFLQNFRVIMYPLTCILQLKFFMGFSVKKAYCPGLTALVNKVYGLSF